MTHTHLDHIGCLAEIQKQLPWAELWMHHSEADLLEQGDERACLWDGYVPSGVPVAVWS